MSKLEEVAAAVENGKAKIVGGLVQEALDEYDIPEFLREEYEAQIEACFVD